MPGLQNDIWKTLDGGYRMPYDASIALQLFESTADQKVIEKTWNELWNELHHQGDVGLASYLALPQLVRIAKAKNIFDWNLLGLCIVIEQQRHETQNPLLPAEYTQYYLDGLMELRETILTHITKQLDNETYQLCLAGLATISGRIKLGKAIAALSEDAQGDFLL